MPVATEQPPITSPSSLDELIRDSEELTNLTLALDRCEERCAEIDQRSRDLAASQAQARRQLIDAATEAERNKAREALAPMAAEALVLPDETVIGAEARAYALHHWAASVREQITQAYDAVRREVRERLADDIAKAEAEAAHQDAGTEVASHRARIHAETRESGMMRQPERDATALRRAVRDRCAPVFGAKPGKEQSTLTKDGTLQGHERWRDHQRAQIEERLRA